MTEGDFTLQNSDIQWKSGGSKTIISEMKLLCYEDVFTDLVACDSW